VIEVPLQDFAETTAQRYDLIVSNPPYFINSTKAPCDNRSAARHTDSLSHEELIQNAVQLLKPSGRICLILPVNEGLHCMEIAIQNGLYCTKQVTVFPKPLAEAKRLLLEFGLQAGEKLTSGLIIETEQRHHYSEEFTCLAKDYYLKL
jgi:tRNA1Val (adenine37-N6)-methyltransferase